MNNILKLEAPWEDVKELLKEAEPELTDEDLARNSDEELITKVAARINRNKEDAKGWIESVSHTTDKAS